MPCPRIAEVCELFPTVGREGVAPGGRVAACQSADPARWEPCHLLRESGESHAGRRCRVVGWPGSTVCRPGRHTIRQANFAEVTRILAAQTRWLSCCLAAIHDQAIGDQISLQRVDGSCTVGVSLLQGLTAIVENRVIELRDLVYAAAA